MAYSPSPSYRSYRGAQNPVSETGSCPGKDFSYFLLDRPPPAWCHVGLRVVDSSDRTPRRGKTVQSCHLLRNERELRSSRRRGMMRRRTLWTCEGNGQKSPDSC